MGLDQTAFERIVNQHYQSLYRFAMTLAGQESEAGDLTQETFHQLARKGHQIRDESKVKSWLFTTLYRTFIDGRRSENRHPHVEMGEADRELPVTEPDVARRLDGVIAREALGKLEAVYRAPLVLFYLGEHSYAEIAGILGVPIGTVMSRIARGRDALRRILADRPRAESSPVNPAGTALTL